MVASEDALPLSSSDPSSPASSVPRVSDAAPADQSARPSFDWHALVEPTLWDQVPADVEDLLRLLPGADLYVQDELNLDLHPTLTRTWSSSHW